MFRLSQVFAGKEEATWTVGERKWSDKDARKLTELAQLKSGQVTKVSNLRIHWISTSLSIYLPTYLSIDLLTFFRSAADLILS